jgi:hypothetical protein
LPGMVTEPGMSPNGQNRCVHEHDVASPSDGSEVDGYWPNTGEQECLREQQGKKSWPTIQRKPTPSMSQERERKNGGLKASDGDAELSRESIRVCWQSWCDKISVHGFRHSNGSGLKSRCC